MAGYKLSGPLNVPMVLLIPTYSKAYGVPEKTFPAVKNGIPIFGTFRTFGGTERDVNGLYSIENTATIETWYRPDIKADCRLVLAQSGAVYEIMGQPENIQMQNQVLRIRVREISGGA